MTNRILLIFGFLAVAFFSCEKDCKLQPIPKNVFDLNKVQKTVLFKSGKEIDSLVLIEKIDNYEKKSFKGPMNYRECEHYKSYEFKFRNETIDVSIRKNDKDTLELDVTAFGECLRINKEIIMSENELSLNKEYVFERKQDCESTNSNIKKIVLKGYLIQSFTTSDNKIWVAE